MRLIAPTILLVHWIGLLIYFTVTRFYPDQWTNYGWSVFYFSINNLTIVNYCLMFVYSPKCKIANQFVLIDVIFTFTLMIATALQYAGIINSTYGFQIAILGMIFTTILIVIKGKKYGYFKNKNEDD